jgi:Domain of unknown function (DUF4340)
VTRRTVQVLAAVVAGLVLMLLVLDRADHDDSHADGRLLLPGFSDHANDAERIRITASGDDGELLLQRVDGEWVVASRDNYPADIGKLRQLTVALAEASIKEEKTSNPQYYDKLGVADPADGGDGTLVVIEGGDFSFAVILGHQAQRDFRYARIPDQPASYLIDKSPDISHDVGDWLQRDLVDIESRRIRRVSITHGDGETIVIEKQARDLTDFSVAGVPAGRELSYASVGNGVAAGLSKLMLDDVRAAGQFTPESTAVFETWNGLQLTVHVGAGDDGSWVRFSAAAIPAEPGAAAAVTGDDQDTPAEDDAAPSAAEAAPTADEEAASLNERLSGWDYRLPDYKKNLLSRRWNDLLKAKSSE